MEKFRMKGKGKISGSGRANFGHVKLEDDAEFESDVAIGKLEVKAGKEAKFKGRTVISADVEADGSMSDSPAQGGGMLRVQDKEPIVFDNAPDVDGTAIGENVSRAIPEDIKTDASMKLKLAARCGRRCRGHERIQELTDWCRSKDPRKLTSGPSKWSDSGNYAVDCGKFVKTCIKRCMVKHSHREVRQKLEKVACDGSGCLGASAGTKVELKELHLPASQDDSDDGPLLSGAPNDEGKDENDASLEAEPSVKIESLPSGKKLKVGCDVISQKTSARKRPCVQVPSDANVTKLEVRVARGKPESVIGRRAVRYAGASGERRLGAANMHDVQFSVEDENGNDVTNEYKTCCFTDGKGVAPLSTSQTKCPMCEVPTTTTTTVTTTVITTSGKFLNPSLAGRCEASLLLGVVLSVLVAGQP